MASPPRFMVCAISTTSLKDMVIVPEEIIRIRCVIDNNAALTFDHLVRPSIKVALSPYCSRTTGIEPSKALGAPKLETVLALLLKWLAENHVADVPIPKVVFANQKAVKVLEKQLRDYDLKRPAIFNSFMVLEDQGKLEVDFGQELYCKAEEQEKKAGEILTQLCAKKHTFLFQGESKPVSEIDTVVETGYVPRPKMDDSQMPHKPQKYDFMLILDFEATCDREKKIVPQEVIEFPAVLVDMRDTSNWKIVDKTFFYVKPKLHPKLTDFCTELTTITQEQVDAAEEFPQVFKKYIAWVAEKTQQSDSILSATCGDWDLRIMLPSQLKTSQISDCPAYLSQWANLKVVFSQHTGIEMNRNNPQNMGDIDQIMHHLELEQTGTLHRGIDDAENLAKAVFKMGKQVVYEATAKAM